MLMALAGLTIVLTGVLIFVLPRLAPATTGVVLNCIPDEDGDCLRLPDVVGINLNGTSISLPGAFDSPFNLVVMPFNQAQQEDATTWLPPFEALAEVHEDVAYYSLAALPDLSPALRLVVQTTMQIAINDEALRDVTLLAYLDDQPKFLEALNIPDTQMMGVFIFNQAGDVLWQTLGNHDEDLAQALSEVLAHLVESAPTR